VVTPPADVSQEDLTNALASQTHQKNKISCISLGCLYGCLAG
jgi:hypothetical protein